MITQTVTVTERNTQNIIIGRRGTYNTEEIVFDLAPLISQFGDGTAMLLVKRSADASAYPAVTERNGSNLVWTISDTDTYYKGHGKCELYWYVDGGLAKTAIWSLTVLRDLGETTEAPPDPYETWVDTLVDLGAETLENAQAAEQSASDAASSAGTAYGYARGAAESQYQAQQARDKAVEARQGAERARDEAWEISSHYPTIIDGYWAVWHDGQYWKTDYKAEGVDGRGITSVTGVKSSTSGLVDTYTLTVTYTDGGTDTITFTVTNGRDGTDGTDGVSPGVTITGITGGHRVIITDKDHPTGQSFDVLDGEVTQADLDAALATKAPVIIDTASGAIASFSDGADGMPIKALTVNIEPQQDLHGYDAPYPSGGSKNKLPLPVAETKGGITLVHNLDGSITITGSSTENVYFDCFAGNFDSAAFAGYTLVWDASYTGFGPNIQFRISESDRVSIQSVGKGSPITIADNGNGLYLALRVQNSTTIQSGGLTIYPMLVAPGESYGTFVANANICPISGFTGCEVTRTGKNLLNPNGVTGTNSGVTFTKASDGTWSTSNTAANLVAYNAGTFTVKKGQTYTLSGCPANGSVNSYRLDVRTNASTIYKAVYDMGGGDGDAPTFIADADATLYVYIRIANGYNASGLTFKPMIRLGSGGDSTFEPYQGETIPITWQTEAGTVYGGYINLTTGVLAVDRAMYTFDGTEAFAIVQNTQVESFNYFRWYTQFVTKIPNWNLLNDAIMSCYPVVNQLNYWYSGGVGRDVVAWTVKGTAGLCIRDDSIATTEDLLTLLTGQTICYKLAQPITVQLDPVTVSTLLGENNIWHDANGDVSVDYCADTKLYLEKLTQPTEDDMTANANIAANKFFMVGNVLYFSTAAIAQGATIVPGTNCNKVSLADALNTLNA